MSHLYKAGPRQLFKLPKELLCIHGGLVVQRLTQVQPQWTVLTLTERTAGLERVTMNR